MDLPVQFLCKRKVLLSILRFLSVLLTKYFCAQPKCVTTELLRTGTYRYVVANRAEGIYSTCSWARIKTFASNTSSVHGTI